MRTKAKSVKASGTAPVLPKVAELTESEIRCLTWLYDIYPQSLMITTMRHLLEESYVVTWTLCKKFAALELITLSTDANRARMIAMNKSGKDYVDAADITSLA